MGARILLASNWGVAKFCLVATKLTLPLTHCYRTMQFPDQSKRPQVLQNGKLLH
jgi:hypothetical protein